MVTEAHKRKLLAGYQRWRKKHPDFYRGKRRPRTDTEKQTISRGTRKGMKKWWRKINPTGRQRCLHGKGCWFIRIKGGRWIPEHRLIMAKKLRRKLTPVDRVRHLNGDNFDNRPENLEVYDRRETAALFSFKPGMWCRKHKECASCHTSTRRHLARGFCQKCYNESKRKKNALHK